MQKRIMFLLILTGFTLSIGYGQYDCNGEVVNKQALELIAQGSFNQAQKNVEEGLVCPADSANLPLLFTKYEILRNRRKYKSAMNVARKIESILDNNQNSEWRLTSTINLAEIYALRNNEAEFRRYYLQAEKYINLVPKDSYLQARLDFIRGFSFLAFYGKEAESLAIYQKTLKALENEPHQDVYLQGQILRALGNRNRKNGDFPQSLRYYRKELELYLKHYVPKNPDIAICHYNIGGVLYEMYEYDKALDHFLKCYENWELIFKPGSRYYRMLTEAIGDMFWELENRKRALEFYDLAAAAENPVNRDSSQAYSEIADTLLGKGKQMEALKYYQQALDFRERNFGKGHPLTAACQNYVGRAHSASGELKEALQAYQHSLIMLTPEFSDTSIYANPKQDAPNHSVQLLLEALAGKGALLLQRAKQTNNRRELEVASQTLLSAVGYLEQFRQSPKSEASKLFWNSRSLPLLENALRSQLLLYQFSDDSHYLKSAYMLAEKSKAFLLLSAIQDDQVLRFSGIPELLTQKERELRKQILGYENKILGEEKRCSAAREKYLELWREKLRNIYQDYDLMLSELQTNYPKYFNLKYQMDIQEVSHIQQTLEKQKMAILEFFEGEESLIVFYIDATQLDFYEVDKDSSYLSLTEKLPRLLNDKDYFLRYPQEAFLLFKQTSSELYKKILKAPLANCPAEIRRLLIIPGQSLSAIPFSCLMTNSTSKVTLRDYSKLPYLLLQYSIAYAPSTTIWLQAMSQEKTLSVKTSYSGFAPDYSNVTFPEMSSPSPLLFSKLEIESCGKIFKGKTFIEKKATEFNFRQQSADILHLAAHALLDDTHPLLSKLLLVPADSTEDGILHAYELYNLPVPSQLTILSACHTAAGTFEKGEGLMSLERAFQYAGCPALLSSFWAADDAASAWLTSAFLENIKNGKSKDIALQMAQQQFLKENDPALIVPFYWAGFRINGNVDPVEIKEMAFRTYLIGFVIVLLIFAVWRKYLTLKKNEFPFYDTL